VWNSGADVSGHVAFSAGAAMAELKKRIEVKVEPLLYSQIQTVKLAQGIGSDQDFLLRAAQQFIDRTAESVTSALFFQASFRNALKAIEGQQGDVAKLLEQVQSEQRFMFLVMALALISPHKLDGILPGLNLPGLSYMDSRALTEHVTEAFSAALQERETAECHP
jgi:hypothetical protein